jgi:hypothetical protein
MRSSSYFGFFTIAICVIIVSCQKGIEKNYSNPSNNYLSINNKILLDKLRQTTYIVSEVFKDKKIRSEFGKAIRKKILKPNTEEAITLKELFNTATDAPFRDLAIKFSGKFLKIYSSGQYMNSHKFPKPSNNKILEKTTYSNNPYDADVLNFEDGRKIYFPYSENYNLDDINELTFSYTPLDQEDVNEGYKVEINDFGEALQQLPCDTTSDGGMYCNFSYEYVDVVNDEYCWNSPTLIVNFKDNFEDITRTEGTDSLPPPITCKDLLYNTSSSSLHQDYIVKTTIPHWKLTDHYRGVFGGASIILLYRISTNLGALTQNPYGYFNPSIDGPFLLLGERVVRRKDIRKENWQFGSMIIWDEDWDLHESEQKILLVSKQGFLSNPPNLQVTAALTIGLDTSNQISASGTLGLTANIDFHKIYKQRYYNTLPRNGIFSSIIGDFGLGTAKSHGLDNYDFPIRPADAFQYYFKHNVCY